MSGRFVLWARAYPKRRRPELPLLEVLLVSGGVESALLPAAGKDSALSASPLDFLEDRDSDVRLKRKPASAQALLLPVIAFASDSDGAGGEGLDMMRATGKRRSSFRLLGLLPRRASTKMMMMMIDEDKRDALRG